MIFLYVSLIKFAVESKRLLILCSLILFIITSCSKKDKMEPEPLIVPPVINASFYSTKTCNYLSIPDRKQLIDSPLNFINTSDTSSKASYKWDFGDNVFSNDSNSIHTYTLPGI